MCGIIGITGIDSVASELYRGLIALQHRGQDAAGIITFDGSFNVRKDNGPVQAVFAKERYGDMKWLEQLVGNSGIGHVRYATVGEGNSEDAQPFKKTYPFAVSMCHNGNVTNYTALREEIYMDTTCDIEAILDVFIKGVQRQFGVDAVLKVISNEKIFEAAGHVMDVVEGSYSIVSYVPKVGMVAFRDPYGIKPLEIGVKSTPNGLAHCFVSESVALNSLRYDPIGSVKPGEVVIADNKGDLYRCQVRSPKVFSPCIFEWIYFARPASIIEGISVSGLRYGCGKKLGEKLIEEKLVDSIDIITDVPATATRGAISCGKVTGLEYFPVFDKNHYVGRSFIESTDLKREHTAALKFTPEMGVLHELTHKLKRGVRVGKVDDSFVRGMTNRNVNAVLRETGMIEYILDCSLSPRIEWPCVYGIDMPIRRDFVARDRNDDEVAKALGSDKVVYLPRESLRMVAEKLGLKTYCEACFSGVYPTGITRKDLERIEHERIADKGCGY